MQSNQHSPREREIESVAVWNGGFEFSVLYFWANTKFPVYWKFPGRFSLFTRNFRVNQRFPHIWMGWSKKAFFFFSRENFLLDMPQRCHVHIVLALPIAISNVAPGGICRAYFLPAPRLLLQGRYICSGSFLPGQIEYLLRDFCFRAGISAPVVFCQGR